MYFKILFDGIYVQYSLAPALSLSSNPLIKKYLKYRFFHCFTTVVFTLRRVNVTYLLTYLLTYLYNTIMYWHVPVLSVFSTLCSSGCLK